MTKCIVLGNPKKKEKKKKRIEFVEQLCVGVGCSDLDTCNFNPIEFNNIELVSPKRENEHEYDVMFAYNDDRSDGIVFLGFWNDGVSK